jgi:hypothetical protein
MKKAIIATCFESNEERAGFVYEACKDRGFDVEILTSDFSHIRKKKREQVPDRFRSIETLPYQKNLSLKRMRSHRLFAKDLFQQITREDPDLIWLMAPANSLILEAKQYKKAHPSVKLIIDIIDMWPESLPLSISKDVFPLNLWKNIRSKNLNCADLVVSECDFYQETLKKEYKGRMETIRWARKANAVKIEPDLPEGKLSLCYIGSINNIIDPEKIADVVSKINMPVILHVIGEGENTERFLKTLEPVCEVLYHGAIREETKKAEIFSKCHAGINIYRDGLYIGLTVKCIDYLQHGLPILNNIKGDTWALVEEYKAGFNIEDGTVINANELIRIRINDQNIYDLFERNFTEAVFLEKCRKVIDEVMK